MSRLSEILSLFEQEKVTSLRKVIKLNFRDIEEIDLLDPGKYAGVEEISLNHNNLCSLTGIE